MAASISGGSAVPLRLDGQFAGGPGEAFRYLVVFAELAVQGFEFFFVVLGVCWATEKLFCLLDVIERG